MGKTLDVEEFLSWLNETEEELKGERADELNPDRKDEGILLATENVRKYVEKMCKIDDADEDCRWIPVTERLPEDHIYLRGCGRNYHLHRYAEMVCHLSSLAVGNID